MTSGMQSDTILSVLGAASFGAFPELFGRFDKSHSDLGQKAPASAYAKFKVMGKEFDPAKPDDYLASFAIKKAS